MDKCDVIIVGAGISGLSFAHYAKKEGLNVLVLEREQQPGGSFDTIKLSDSSQDFWIELGAHTCYNSYGSLIEIMEECGIIAEAIPRAKVPYKLWLNGQFKSFMSQIGFMELIASLPKAFGKKKVGETVSSYYGSILGRKNFKRVFSALFSAVPSQIADDFPADALFKKREKRKDILGNYTMKKGLKSIADAIIKHQELNVKYGSEIIAIDRKGSGYSIRTKSQEYECDNLAICTSVNVVPLLIGIAHADVASKISQIRFQSIESFGVMVEKAAISMKPFAGLVPVNDTFFSVVSRDTVPDEHYRGFTFHFKPGVLTWKQKAEKVCSILGLATNQIVEMREKSNIVPSLRLGHYELIAEIDALLKEKNLFLSGNYFAGLAIEDCVVRSKSEVNRMKK